MKKDLIRDPESSAQATAWLDETNNKAARAMAGWLKAALDLNRPIASMSLLEMKALAHIARTIYEDAMLQRRRPAQTPEEEAQLDLWLG